MTTVWLSAMDSVNIFSYAIGNIISGSLEDHYSLRYMISGGLMLSSLIYWIIVLLGVNNIYIPILYVFCWCLQGLVQSTVWPGCIALLGRWFDKHNRGKVMGSFGISSIVGSFTTALISGKLLSSGVEWTSDILIFSSLQFIVGVLFLIFVRDAPEEILNLDMPNQDILMIPINQTREMINIEKNNKQQEIPLIQTLRISNPEETPDTDKHNNGILMTPINQSREIINHEENHHKKGIPFIQALRIPNVINFALAFACSRIVTGTLFMWFPFYLQKIHFSSESIGLLISLIDITSLFGGICCGWLGDKFESRTPFLSLFLIFAMPCIFGLAIIEENFFWVFFIAGPMTGFFLGGVGLIFSSVIPADLAQHKSIANLYNAMATVTGIVDGTAGIGSASGIIIVGFLANTDWMYVFSFLILMASFSFLLIFKISILEIKKFYAKRSQRSQS